MTRILLLIILFWILFLVLKRFWSQFTSQTQQKEKKTDAEKIVPCNQCGLHIPESESLTLDGLIYCKNPKCQPSENTHDR
jgi:formylmethanofuran dehydrogenase subunit E